MKKKWNQTFKFSPKLLCVAVMSIKCGTSFQNLMSHLNLFICFWKCENSFENYVISWRLTKTNLMEFRRNYKTFVDQIMTWFKLQIEFFDDFLWNSANMKEIAIVLQRKNIIKQMKLQTTADIWGIILKFLIVALKNFVKVIY